MGERVPPSGTASQLYSNMSQTEKETSSLNVRPQFSPTWDPSSLSDNWRHSWGWWPLSFWSWICLLKLSAQQQTPLPYWPMSFSCFLPSMWSFIPSSCFLGLITCWHLRLLCPQEEHQSSQTLLPSNPPLAGRTPLHGVCPLCPTWMGALLPMVATGQWGGITCALGVILCKSTSEFRPVSTNLLS